VLVQLSGHQPGYREVPGLIPSWGFSDAAVSLGKKLYHFAPATQLLNWDIMYHVYQGTDEEQPLTDAVIPVKIKCKNLIPLMYLQQI